MRANQQVMILFIALVMSSSFSFGQITAKDSGLIAEFGKRLQEDLQTDNLHGSMSLAIIRSGHILWQDAFGYTSQKDDRAADTLTIYRIGSLSKTITATILMQLIEEGKMKLDDPAINYVPEIKNLKGYTEKTKITLRELASHTWASTS